MLLRKPDGRLRVLCSGTWKTYKTRVLYNSENFDDVGDNKSTTNSQNDGRSDDTSSNLDVDSQAV